MMIEQLPSELWLEIFSYLNSRDQFNGFYNLNKRINGFLLNYYYHINLKGNDDDSHYLFEHILPQLPSTTCISSLKLEHIDKKSLIKNFNVLRFPHLQSITLCHLSITNDILNLIRAHVSHLRYLDITSFVSSNWTTLLELILSLPNLHICYLHLGIALCPMKSSNLSRSPIRHLKLLGPRQSCNYTSLISLLTHLPHLNSLHIECDQLQFTRTIPVRTIINSISLSQFSLKVNHLPELFDDFISFITSIAPHVIQLCEVSLYKAFHAKNKL